MPSPPHISSSPMQQNGDGDPAFDADTIMRLIEDDPQSVFGSPIGGALPDIGMLDP